MVRNPFACIFLFILLGAHGLHASQWDGNGLFRIDSLIGVSRDGDVQFAFGHEKPADSLFLDTVSNYTMEQFVLHVDRRPFWIRVSLTNQNAEQIRTTIRLSQPHTADNIILIHNGTAYHGIAPKGDHGYYYADLVIPAGKSVLYVRNESVLIRVFPRVDLVHHESMAEDDIDKFLQSRYSIVFLIAFLGLLMFQSIYVFVQFWINRLPEYLNYLFFILCLLVYFFCRLDYWYNTGFMMDGIPVLAPYLNDVFLLAPFIFYLRFCRWFIDTVNHYPRTHGVIKIVEKGIVGLIILSVVFVSQYQSGWSILLVRVFTIVFFIFSIFVIWQFYRQNNKLVNFILVGSFFALVGNALAVLLPVFGVHPNFDHSFFTMSGIVAEIMMFNIGLSFKIKTIQAEKIQAQNAVIHELDRSRKYMQEMEGMRSQIADDLHDDVGSTLSSISVYAELGLQGDENTRLSMLGRISDASQRMMSAMNDIVWAIHSKNDSLGDLTDKMRQFATERLVGENVTFKLDNEKLIDNLHLTMRARRNILLMFKEAVHNALKHGKAKNVLCAVKSITSGLSVMIKDDGVGFDPHRVKSGNGITSMRKRATELGGSFEIESVQGKGTTIFFTVPLNKLTIET